MGGARLIDEVSAGLVERGAAMHAVQALVDATCTGAPAVLCVDGVAGMGKTSVLGVARDLAARSGVRVQAARGSELEGTIAYAVLRDLLAALPPTEDRRLAPVLADAPVPQGPDPDATHRTHLAAVEYLRAAVDGGPPILLVVDDAQWADAASLAALAALAARLDDDAVGLLLAARPAAAGTPPGPLDTIRALPAAHVVPLAPLTPGAARTVLADLGPDRAAALADACHVASGGVPFYLAELAADLGRRPEATARDVAALRPIAVRRSVVLRVAAVGPAAVDLARAIAVLGDGAPLRRAAALAGIEPDTAARTVDALQAADVLGPGDRLAFAHPILASAVLTDTPASVRAELHAGAARLLRAEGAGAPRVAAHLLRTPAGADPQVAAELAAAGTEALGRGAMVEAVALLTRALGEPPPPEARAAILVALGTAELLAGRPAAAERLDRAAEATTDPAAAAQVTALRVTAAALSGRFADGLAIVAAAEADGMGSALARRLDGHVAVAACSTLSGRPVARAALARLRRAKDPGPIGRSTLVLDGLVSGGVPASVTVERARAALRLAAAETGADAISARYPALYALIVCGAYADAREGIEALDRRADASGSRMQSAMVAATRAQLAAHRGEIAAAAEQGRRAIDLGIEAGFGVGVLVGTAWLGFAEIERGALDAAERVLALPITPPLDDAGAALYIRFEQGRLAAARGNHAGALRQQLAVADGLDAWEWHAPVEHRARGAAGRAAAALGDVARARVLVEADVTAARALGAAPALGAALTARAEALGDVVSAREAVAVLDGSGADLLLAQALLAVGSLTAAEDRVGARPPLRRALDLAAGLGATATAIRARTLLVATGARPRRAASTGVGALTDRERRVAGLAAAGLANREIAAREICAVKTVEVHLTNAYRKLGVTRAGLPAALAAEE